MTVVKICGITEVEHALSALEAGADLLGFVLAPSRRRSSPERVATMVDRCRRSFPPQQRPWQAVGVFANQPLEFVLEAAAQCSLDIVQLSGQEAPEYCRRVHLPVFRAVHVPDLVLSPEPAGARAPVPGAPGDPEAGFPASEILEGRATVGAEVLPDERRPSPSSDSRTPRAGKGLELAGLEGALRLLRERCGAARLLLDSGSGGRWGGTGRPFPWASIGPAARDCLVAGGLTPGNVARAMAVLRPWGVDVSSGVESDGRKDPDLIRRFIIEVRRADADG